MRCVHLFISVVLLFVISCSHIVDPKVDDGHSPVNNVTHGAERTLTPDTLRADITLVRRALKDIHPGYERYMPASVIDASWGELITKATSPMSDREFYVGLSRVLAGIRCDHTKAELPPALAKFRRETPSLFPFKIFQLGNNTYVYSALPRSDILSGDRIVSIGSRSIEEIRSQIYDLLPIDGHTVHSRAAIFESSGDFLGSGFEHFYSLLYGNWQRRSVTVERDGELHRFSMEPISWDQWRQLPQRGGSYRQDFADAVHFSMLEDDIGYLKIDTFVNYRRYVEPKTVYAPIFAELRENRAKSLILDTRANGGGSDDAQLALLAHLIDKPHALLRSKQVKTIDLSSYAGVIKTWDPRALSPDPESFVTLSNGWYAFKPERDPLTLLPTVPANITFSGKVYALTSSHNASAVTMLLATLRDRVDATLVGEPTGGSSEGPTAGQIFFLNLPGSGITVRIPWQLQQLNTNAFEPGLGVTPDHPLSVGKIDVLERRDVALELALKLARGHM